jgi:hypothetical protein
MGAPLQRLIAQVEATNDKGVKLEGEWRNFSRYAKPEAIQAHTAGQWVEVQLDGAGFVRVLMVSVTKPATPAAPGEPLPSEPFEDVLPAQDQRGPSKDLLIVRQTCLKVAAEFTASRTDLKCADLVTMAEHLERWCWR